MPELRKYHIFISHAWRYSDDYNRLIDLLDHTPEFSYSDYSINQDKSLTQGKISDYILEEKLKEQIRNASVVLVLLGMYYEYHSWMQTEFKIAKEMGKPIIGILPWGQKRGPDGSRLGCTAVVGWNKQNIVNHIRLYGRN